MDQHLSPAETARRFGITIKALRLYERHGLLKPARSKSGWRAYGPDQIARLHQIIALKRLGLPLAKIGALLKDADALDDVLALQERALARDSEKLAHALALVRAARAKLASGASLSIDDLANLTKETVMTAKPTLEEAKALVAPILARHFTPQESQAMLAARQAHMAEWEGLLPLAQAALTKGDPASPEARHVAERFRAIGRAVVGISGNAEWKTRLKAFRAEAMADPRLSPVMMVTPEMEAFLKKAIALLD